MMIALTTFASMHNDDTYEEPIQLKEEHTTIINEFEMAYLNGEEIDL